MKRFFNFNSSKAVEIIKQKKVAVIEKPVTNTKQYPEEVIMIHNEFLNASEILLKQAQQILKTNLIDPKVESKAKLASELGFKNINEVIEQKKIDYTVAEQNKMLKAVNEAKSYIPTHKWIPESKVEEICKKWNLVFGNSNQYKGFVPEKNLLEIKSFKDNYYDKFWVVSRTRLYEWLMSDPVETQYISKEQAKDSIIAFNKENDRKYSSDLFNTIDILKICAPIKDMNLKSNQTIENGWKIKKIEIPDPIVLAKRDFNGIKGYYIITAWGDEASDPDVINQNNN